MDLSTTVGAAAAIRSREISPAELLDRCLARVDAVNDRINAVVIRDDALAREQAQLAAERLARGEPEDLPPFLGVPIPIKDLVPAAGWPATYGSRGAPDGPAGESALVVEALQRAGFVLAGRTNTPEFGPITITENVRYGPTRNPWNLEHTPGGSSGGAAAAVAAGMFTAAHASDGGGSIRIPASCCGLVGLKPSRGRVPSLVMSWEGGAVDGVEVRTVADAAAILDVISGPDPLCWYNAPAPDRPFAAEVGEPPGTLRVGVLEQAPLGLPLDDECRAAVQSAADALSDLGHRVDSVELGVPDDALASFLNVVNSGLADYPGIDWDRTEPHIRANLAAARGIDSLTYVDSVHQLQRFSRELVARWGRDFDVLLTPTMSIAPPAIGVLDQVHADPGGTALPVFQMAIFTAWFNVTGQPAISLPLHVSPAGLPIGVQLVASPWRENVLIRLAAQLEAAHPWPQHPQIFE